MKNFKITSKENGKEYWISRSMAIVGIVYSISPVTGEVLFLVSKRGKGSPDEIGKWQLTCGYLDFDETKKEAVKRELYEELGLKVDLSDIHFFYEVDDPKRDKRQNVTTRYLVELSYENLKNQIQSGEVNNKTFERGGEKDEIDEIKLISVKDIKNFNWAFNHDEVLKDVNYYLTTGINPLVL